METIEFKLQQCLNNIEDWATENDMASMIRDLAVAIIRDGKVPSDWEQSFIVCLYKGKEDALERGNYRGLKLTEQVMKILERIVDGLIRQLLSIDDSQFGFVPGRGTIKLQNTTTNI